MNGGVTVAPPPIKSVLDKPLLELTEDDISQLTREDCRRFLKEKGMRRPSWNKSQAIQQVISLKSLLEPSPPNIKRTVRLPPHNSPPITTTTTNTVTVNSNSSSSVKELSPAEADGSVSALAEDEGPYQPAGISGLAPPTEVECCPTVVKSKGSPVRCTDAPHLQFDQMTIFYSGKVNVYDGVPVDKARAIMHLAASPIQLCQDEPICGNPTNLSSRCTLPTSSVNVNVNTLDAPVVQSMLTGKTGEPFHCKSEDFESQTNRQVSLQRYYEKKKDRGRFKMKRKMGSSSSGMQVYLNHQMRTPVTDRQTSEFISSSGRQVGLPPICYGLMDKQPKNSGLSVDLNDKA